MTVNYDHDPCPHCSLRQGRCKYDGHEKHLCWLQRKPGKFPAAYPPTLPCNNQLTNDAIMSPATECSNKESDINISNHIKHHTFRPYKTQSSMWRLIHEKLLADGSQVLLSLPTKPNPRPAPNLGRQFVPASFPHARISLPQMKWWQRRSGKVTMVAFFWNSPSFLDKWNKAKAEKIS